MVLMFMQWRDNIRKAFVGQSYYKKVKCGKI
jgi:hypothetical protein